jgi:hypothetical protein
MSRYSLAGIAGLTVGTPQRGMSRKAGAYVPGNSGGTQW